MRSGRSVRGFAGLKRSSTCNTVGPLCQAMAGVRCATPSPWRATTGIAIADKPAFDNWFAIPASISMNRLWLKPTRSILLTTTATSEIPRRCSRCTWRRVWSHTFRCVDHQQGAIGLRRTGDHAAHKFGVTGGVNQYDVARGGAKTDLAGIERD